MPPAVSFLDLGVPATLARVLADREITVPTPIQAATLADSISGRDVLGRGRTGSGKTYAFLLPLITRLTSTSAASTQSRRPRALILAPTRELVGQIKAALDPLAATAGLTSVTVFGGVSPQSQIRALRSGVDVVIACPGRLEDLIKQGACRLDRIDVTVLDEADHMADLGFLPSVTRLLAQTPPASQRLLFSATLDAGVDGLVKRFLRRPATHEADSAQIPVTAMAHHVLHLLADQRIPVLADLTSAPGRTLVFTRTKHRAKSLARQLNARGIRAVELHGNLNQNARDRNLEAFHSGRVATLVATDIAARGIHVDDLQLVVHADPPVEHKAYVHRSGRTARAGKAGTVVTLATQDQLRDVRALTKAAGVQPTTTTLGSTSDAILRQLAPGDRMLTATPSEIPAEDRPRHDAGSRSRRPARRRTERTADRPKRSADRPTSPGKGRPSPAGGRHNAALFSARARAR
ncbi:MAG TPA: DEAD/DEAH box helicase [Microlunatus sp.]